MRARHPAENRRRQSPRDVVISLVIGILLVGYGGKTIFTLPDYGSLWTGLAPFLLLMLGASFVANGLYGLRRLRAKPIPGVVDADSIELAAARTLPKPAAP